MAGMTQCGATRLEVWQENMNFVLSGIYSVFDDRYGLIYFATTSQANDQCVERKSGEFDAHQELSRGHSTTLRSSCMHVIRIELCDLNSTTT